MEIMRRLAQPEEAFDAETLRRARGYVRLVSSPQFDELTHTRVTVRAQVAGTSPVPYTVQLEADLEGAGGGLRVLSVCSCPVQLRCKHGAALAMSIGATFSPAVTRSPLEQLLADLDDLAPAPGPPLPGVGLELSVPGRSRTGRGTGELVTLRPLRPGRRQAWARTGLSWSEVPAALRDQRFDREQLRALDKIRQVALHDYWYSRQEPTLADLGPGAVGLLRDAVAAGVTLVAGPPLAAVELLPEPLALVVEAGNDDHGHPGLEVGLRHDGRLWSGPDVVVHGEPATTVTLLRDGERLLVGALDPPLPAGPARALRRGGRVPIGPGAGSSGAEVLRRVARLVPVESDGTVEVPEPVRPRLRVTVVWLSGSEAEVRWAWVYDDDVFALRASAPPSVLRDLPAERALLARLDPAPADDLVLVAGVDVLHLALLEVPAWRALDDVEVVEHDRPDFRESDQAPELAFVQSEPAGDAPASGPTDWLDLEVVLTVEGERLWLPDLLAALTRGDEHVVLPSGLFVRTDRPEFERLAQTVRAAAELRARPGRGEAAGDDDAGGRLRVSADDLGTWAELSDLGAVDRAAADWVARARALRDLVDLPEPHPVGITSTLRPYQRDGVQWLVLLWQHGLGGILADDMGLGKTLQVLSLVAHARAARPDDPPFLVVAPTSVVGAWVGEAARHAPHLDVRAVTASRARRGALLDEVAAGADVVVTSYTLLRLEAEAYADLPWSGLVLDEAQQVKNHQSKAHAAARGVRAPFRLAVTGTPFENRLSELWSLLAVAAPGLYPHHRRFLDTVATPVEKEGDTAALRRLTRRIKPFVLRRTKELVAADLPPKQEQRLPVVLGSRHRKLYDAHLAQERQKILGLIDDGFDTNRVAVLAALTRLRQLSLDPALVDPAHDSVGSAKIDTLVEHLHELAAEGHRALVFSQFTGFLGRVRDRLAAEGLETAYLDGATRRRAEVMEAFRTGTAPAFLISLKAGGVGLTLTEADYVFVLDPWWNPAAEAQAVDRAHRIGQDRPVMVYRLVATDTIEEKVVALQERKARLFAQVLDGEAGLAEAITADDVRGLLDP